MIELWLSDRACAALEIDEVPVRYDPDVEWGTSQPRPAQEPDWLFHWGATRRYKRGSLTMWRLSYSAARWLAAEIENRVAAFRLIQEQTGCGQEGDEARDSIRALLSAKASLEEWLV